jgi:hypothetical protein
VEGQLHVGSRKRGRQIFVFRKVIELEPVRDLQRTFTGAKKYCHDSVIPAAFTTRENSFSRNSCRIHFKRPALDGRGWNAQ